MAEDSVNTSGSDSALGATSDDPPGEPASAVVAEPESGRPGEAPPPATATRTRRSAGSRAVSAAVALVACAVPFVVMCAERRFRFSVPLGFVAFVVATWGILDALGAFDAKDEPAQLETTLGAVWPRFAELTAAVAAHLGVLALCVAGVLPKQIVTAAVLVPSTFVWAVSAFYKLGRKLGAWQAEGGVDRALTARHGFWLVALNALLYLPLLGSYSLSDPWETHYGEVAREMLARDDWISTWWAQDGWFWSKPVLDFWIQALDFSMLGVQYMPDRMLAAAGHGHFPQPEWACRMPVFLLTLVGAYALYKAVAKVAGRRAGFVSGLALTTMPYWYLIAHQTMTDMPYVSTLTGAMAMALLGFVTDPEQRAGLTELRVGKRTFRLSGLHLVFLVVIVSTLPQVLYLASRNVTLHLGPSLHGFRFHADEFFAGSGEGNCGIPGNQSCTPEHPVHKEVFAFHLPGGINVSLGSPLHFAVLWTFLAAVFLYTERHQRRLQRVYFLGAWYFLSLSMMGKGAPGLVLPIVSALGFVAVTRRWKDLERMELGSLALVVACVGLPWYVQMFMRHGAPFIDRLIMHDMYKRAFVHVHDTNQGDDTSFRYYVWQLGYGLFPWTGLSAGGLLYWLRRADRSNDKVADASTLMVVWFLAAFGMFTITLTKFHHYILPLVPAIAVLTGIMVDRMLGEGSPVKPGKLRSYVVSGTASILLAVYGIARLFPRRIGGEALVGAAPSKGWGVLCIALGVAALVVTVRRFGAKAEAPSEDPVTRYDSMILALLGIASAIVVGLVGRDLFTGTASTLEGEVRLLHLFTYNYTRPWPETLEFKGAMVGFTVVCAALSLGMCVQRFRAHAAMLFCAAASVWTAWGLDVYLYKCAPHWGQRETILAYYQDRTNDNQPFVAYQMNWKGENFYTGNKTPAFVSSGEKFKEYVNDQKAHGVRRVYFITEHGRVGSLRRELGDPKSFKELTDKALNNKFLVARIEF
jgi:4-amino-4-deoxy-L-arabinose transferase-like glycosyltransferase